MPMVVGLAVVEALQQLVQQGELLPPHGGQ